MAKKRISKSVARKIGDALKVNWNNINIEQFRRGLEVELEHRNVTHGSYLLTGKIALAHLKEYPDYYTRLKKVETRR